MYEWLLFTHSILRWVVIALGAIALVTALSARSSPQRWDGGRWAGAFAMSAGLQFLLGLALYVTSPITHAALENMRLAMKTSALRFWAIEHAFGMIVAVALAQIGWLRARHAPVDADGPRIAARWVGIALLILVVSVPWPFYPAGRALWPSLP